jgi:sigma-B regulation protein RsbU (phosphoserine phosphatase)
MKRRGLSIKYKILLLLTLVPLVTLAIYLYIAIGVFKKDKLAYVYDSGVAVAKTLSSQTTTELNSVLASAKPIMQEFLSQRSFGKVSQSIFESESKLQWIAAFRKTDGKFEKLSQSEKTPNLAQRDLQSFGSLEPLLTEASTRGRLIRVPFKDDRVLIVERVGEDSEDEQHFFLILSRLPDLVNSFRAGANSDVFLINDKGFVLFGPQDSEATYITTKMPTDFLTNSLAQNLDYGTAEVKANDGKSILASFSKTNFGDLTVISLLDRDAAFQAVEDLIRTSLVFFVLLISGSTLVSLFASANLTGALTELFAATKKVALGDFEIRVQVKSGDEVGSLGESFNAMATEVSRLMGETAEKARMESELKTAQTVQETLFPPTVAQLNGLNIAGHYEPASECGGDWWHYCQVDHKIFLWIGDATGHGAPAALITSAAKSAATIIERLDVETGHALELMNRAIYDVSKGRIMMTFFLACFDQRTHELTYANASHEAPYLLKASEQPLKKKDLIPLNDVNNPRLGQDRETKYEQVKIKLNPGDRILFFTDGIPDIENPEKVAWGEREFVRAILTSNNDHPAVADSVQNLVDQFSLFRKGAPLKDDITFFMAQDTRSSL